MAIDDAYDRNPGESPGKNEVIEPLIFELERRIEKLKTDYILYFSGENKLPPEKERVELEKAVRHVQIAGAKSARVNLMIQNLASRFTLFNNMWLKRMSEIETGISPKMLKKRSTTQKLPDFALLDAKQIVSIEVPLSLSDDKTFEALYEQYSKFAAGKVERVFAKDQLIKSMKEKMSGYKLTDANVVFSYQDKKVNIKLKKK